MAKPDQEDDEGLLYSGSLSECESSSSSGSEGEESDGEVSAQEPGQAQARAAALIAAGMCAVCGLQPHKYCCPGCSCRTCSLPCSKQHKAATGCTGQRDRLAFVPMQSFDDKQLLSGRCKPLARPACLPAWHGLPACGTACLPARLPAWHGLLASLPVRLALGLRRASMPGLGDRVTQRLCFGAFIKLPASGSWRRVPCIGHLHCTPISCTHVRTSSCASALGSACISKHLCQAASGSAMCLKNRLAARFEVACGCALPGCLAHITLQSRGTAHVAELGSGNRTMQLHATA